MRYKTRRNLFVLFTLLFFISIVPIILYTQGYRPDTKNFTLTKTGGLDLDVITSSSEVYLNSKFQRETNFLFRNAVFRNILPGEYNIEIKKAGYNTWNKISSVEEGQVTKFPTIRLFPLELEKVVLKKDIEKLFLSENGKFSMMQISSPSTTDGKDASQLIFYDLSVRLPIPLLTLEAGETVRDVVWTPSGIFYILIDNTKGSSLYTGGIGQGKTLTDWSSFLNKGYPIAYEENTDIIPSDSVNILYMVVYGEDKTYSLNRLDLEQNLIRPNITTDMLGFNIKNDEIFYLDKLGSLKRTDISNKNTIEITPTAISKPDIVQTKIIVRSDNRAIAVLNKNALFFWQEDSPLEKISNSVLSVSFSPDNRKMLYRKEDEVIVYWTEDIFGPPQRILGDKETIYLQGINNARWIGNESNHIAMQTSEKIILTELDGRDKRNTVIYDIKTDKNFFKVDTDRQEIYTLFDKTSFIYLKYE